MTTHAVDAHGHPIQLGDYVQTPQGTRIVVGGMQARAFRAADCTKLSVKDEGTVQPAAEATNATAGGSADGDTVIWGT